MKKILYLALLIAVLTSCSGIDRVHEDDLWEIVGEVVGKETVREPGTNLTRVLLIKVDRADGQDSGYYEERIRVSMNVYLNSREGCTYRFLSGHTDGAALLASTVFNGSELIECPYIPKSLEE
jgi:hypothetical protein